MAQIAVESVIDKAALIDRFSGNSDLIRQMIEAFLEVSPKLIAEIRRASDERNGQNLERAVWVLKGAVGSLFAQSAYEAAQRLEDAGLKDNPVATGEVLDALEKEASLLARHLAMLREDLAAKGGSLSGASR